MKKVIKGKTYNTENAPCLCEWDNGEDPTNSLFYLEEGLYQKKDGSYFVAGRGGAKTKYAKYIGVDSWAGGSDITPVTDAQARKLVKNKRPEKYEEIFGSSDRYEIIDDNGERIAAGSPDEVSERWEALKDDPYPESRYTLWEVLEDGSKKVVDEVSGKSYEEKDREQLREYAGSLYDGGWRADDKAELKYQYNFTDWELGVLCEILDEIDNR